jgi:hypothetical protein
MSQFNAQLEDLERRYAAAVDELDSEWQAPEKQTGYTKPSAKLLNMRVMLKGMIKARRFCDVEVIGKLIVNRNSMKAKRQPRKCSMITTSPIRG